MKANSLNVGKFQLFALCSMLFMVFLLMASCNWSAEKPSFVIVIHGGAGTIKKENISPEEEKEITAKLDEALEAGKSILEEGGEALDAVEAAIRVMEDSPLFNAGKGAVFNELGQNEMDASIMDGRDLNAGAVAGVRHIKNPISAARAVMEKSKHVMLIGQGAENFARSAGLELVDTSYFWTERRWESFQRAKRKAQSAKRADSLHKPHTASPIPQADPSTQHPASETLFGTVGCAVLDAHGNLAAGTSTGGMTNKMQGRVGDSPIIGAGTYADNNTCAVSGTGHGEYFIRNVLAYQVSAMMEYKKMTLRAAAEAMVQGKLKDVNASAGMIGVDRHGNVVMEFNTEGMYRGYLKSGGEKEILLYR